MIDTCKKIYAEDVEVGDELDLDGDEYGDNELAVYGYAEVIQRNDYYSEGESWVYLITTQGKFDIPASHKVSVKVEDE